jgi:hypothetical protein
VAIGKQFGNNWSADCSSTTSYKYFHAFSFTNPTIFYKLQM